MRKSLQIGHFSIVILQTFVIFAEILENNFTNKNKQKF